MTIGRVSTLALQQSTLANVGRVQLDLADLQGQISSGNKTQNFQGLNGQVEQYTDLTDKIAKAQAYTDSNNLALSRMKSTNSALDNIVQTVSDIQNLIVARRSATGNSLQFGQQMDSLKRTLASELNTTLEGRYLFGGTRTDVPPVKDPVPGPASIGMPDAGYYQGSQDDLTLRAQDNFTLTYNVRADDTGFQKVFAAIDQAIKGDTQGGVDDDFKNAVSLVQNGLQDIIGTQAGLNGKIVSVQNINDQNDALQTYWKGVSENLSKTDILSATTKVSLDQAVLTASFQVFARITSLRLSDYLR